MVHAVHLLVQRGCLCFSLDWPVRTLSFSYDGLLLASASEDLIIDIAEVETGRCRGHIHSHSTIISVVILVLSYRCLD